MISDNVRKIRERIVEISRETGRETLPRLVGVTKKRSLQEVQDLIAAGVLDLGENRWDEWELKAKILEEDPEHPVSWHFIGGLQSRSLRRYYRPIFRIDSLDSIEHARFLSDLARSHAKRQNVLLEVNLLRDPGRSGFLSESIEFQIGQMADLPGILLRGLMVMGPVPDPLGDRTPTVKVFEEGWALWSGLKRNWPFLEELSMGMSEDYEEGIRCGATEVRIGRYLFEEGLP